MKHVAIPETPHPLELKILNTLFDAGGSMAMAELRKAIPVKGGALHLAIRRQAQLGNMRRPVDGEPLTMTASGRSAVAAGRAHGDANQAPLRRAQPIGAEALGRTIALPVTMTESTPSLLGEGITLAAVDGGAVIGVHTGRTALFARLSGPDADIVADAFAGVLEVLTEANAPPEVALI